MIALSNINPNNQDRHILTDVTIIQERVNKPSEPDKYLKLPPSQQLMSEADHMRFKELISSNLSDAEKQNEKYLKLLEKKARHGIHDHLDVLNDQALINLNH